MSSAVKTSSSPKSGATKGLIAGGGDTGTEERGCPSGAEKSEVDSMSDPSQSLVILVYGLRMRMREAPKSTSAAVPSSTPTTRPSPYTSCVT